MCQSPKCIQSRQLLFTLEDNTLLANHLITKLPFMKTKAAILEEFGQKNLPLIIVLAMHVELILALMGNF
jgi:hypothetical protein